ncbi:DUF6090 family protein [Ichthyenterobacterium sp. W332]|uniref:DUF6090 family protein n=1 Tax=Microcosmobacter mediterraneus TaxID=3075607 RepID=A0ABU2YKB7_9FLAO|nr:DUF6090 family protein [Ichthyenterobacterium sp. W332]MDT0558257.1 DUF6090 family protein [Ichthyenterobacterium sp. W332]
MIKFFRHIRQQLVMENKTGRYFKYAIGEIILVVIGILIALSINNWNTNRLVKANEVNSLKQLNIDLKENYKELTDIYNYIDNSNNCGKKLLNHLEHNTTITDSLRYWVERFSGGNIFNNANTTYKNLENSSQNIISNDSLRLRITLMYEYDFANVHKREQMVYQEYFPIYKKELLENFKTGPIVDQWLEHQTLEINTPKDIEDLRENDTFKNAFVQLYNFRLLRLNWLNETIPTLEKLITDIDKEIKSKD